MYIQPPEPITPREALLQRLLLAVTILTRTRSLAAGQLKEAFRDILRMASRTLMVRRTSLWFLDSGRTLIQCSDLYDEAQGGFTSGLELRADLYPAYFEEILRSRVVAAGAAQTDPRTREFTESYLVPLGITSMLDVPIKRSDHLVGVVCHEHVGEPREWLEEEIQFASFVSSLVTLAMDFHSRLTTAQAGERRE